MNEYKYKLASIILLTTNILTFIFLSNYKISRFNYTGVLIDQNKNIHYLYTDKNNVKHLSNYKHNFKIVITNMNDYIND